MSYLYQIGWYLDAVQPGLIIRSTDKLIWSPVMDPVRAEEQTVLETASESIAIAITYHHGLKYTFWMINAICHDIGLN